VLERKEGCRRSAGHPDLRVDVLHVMVGGAGRDMQPLGDLAGWANSESRSRGLA